jgi:hypothetical protein
MESEKRVKVIQTGEEIRFANVDVPRIAYPTIVLALFAVSLHITGSILYFRQDIGDFAVLLINGFAAYLSFSPMHDATHSSIATVKSGHKYINYVIGTVCGWMFTFPFEAFKYMHLQHHQHNGHKQKDPYRVSFIYHWKGVLSKMYTFMTRDKSVEEPVIDEGLNCVLNFNTVGIYGLILYGIITNPRACLVCWVLPGRLSLRLLMIIFGEFH